MSKATKAAVAAIKQLNAIGKFAFITSESCGPESRYLVVCKFRTMQQEHAYHQALIDCGNAAEMIMQEENESRKKPSKKSKA